MGLDARVRYTKMIIQTNFVALLKQKPIDKITVKEICDLAEINRATFYKYYLNAFDLLEKIEDEILGEFQETVQNITKENINEILIQLLKRIKENSDLYITLFSGYGDTKFILKIFHICYTEFSAYISRQFPETAESHRAWGYVYYTVQGISGVLQYWIFDGMTIPPENTAEFIKKMISSTLQNIAKDQ